MSDRDRASTARVEISDRDQVVVAVVNGELDMLGVDSVGTVLLKQVSTSPQGLIVDLAVTFIGSAGLSMLLEMYGQAQREGIGFAIVVTDRAALRALEISGMDQVLPLAKSVDDAVDTIRQAPPS